MVSREGFGTRRSRFISRQYHDIHLQEGKNKGKFVPVLSFSTEHHALKGYWENGVIAPRILDLGARWK
jgi:hypothetical protein